MEWKEAYKDRITTASEAIKSIRDNDYVVFSHAAGIPQEVPRELMAHKDNYRNVHIYHMLSIGPGEYFCSEAEGHFRHITNFAGGNSRQAIADNRADFLPCFFFEVPKLVGEIFPVNVAVIQVSPPDEEGYCSFGVACDYTKPATEKASIVIAEVNECMPYVGGDNKIHLSQLDYIIPCSNPLPEIALPLVSGDWAALRLFD